MPEQRKTSYQAAPSSAAAQSASGQEKAASSAKNKKKRRAGMPLFLKIMLVPFLLFIALLGGLVTGYSIIGDGSALDVFNLNTWKHMYDLVFG